MRIITFALIFLSFASLSKASEYENLGPGYACNVRYLSGVIKIDYFVYYVELKSDRFTGEGTGQLIVNEASRPPKHTLLNTVASHAKTEGTGAFVITAPRSSLKISVYTGGSSFSAIGKLNGLFVVGTCKYRDQVLKEVF